MSGEDASVKARIITMLNAMRAILRCELDTFSSRADPLYRRQLFCDVVLWFAGPLVFFNALTIVYLFVLG